MSIRAVIKGIDFAVPQKRVSNDELASYLDTSDEWIYSHTGIKNRHIAEKEQATSDLALQASIGALKRASVPAEQLDLILVATVTGDFPGFPSTACILQDKLGAIHAAAMDVQAGCTGFIYALETARCFASGGGYKNILVVGAETLSRITNWQDRNTCVLFGDGAGAAVVSADESPGDRGILFSLLRADGSGSQWLERHYGGSRYPTAPASENGSGGMLRMDGRQVYNFATKVVSEGVLEVLSLQGLSVDDLSYVVPHQANVRIIEAAAKRSKIPLEKFYVNIEDYANTSAASIPIALSEMEAKGLLKSGDLVLTFGFGAGLTYGGNLIRW